ncbi:hypothetical protein MASR1M6_03510 [Rubrivivax sp.]
MRDEGRATGCRHDDEAKRGRRHARLLEPLLQRRGKLGLRRGRGEQAAAQQQRGKRSCKAAAAEAGADRQKNGKQHAQAGRVGRLRVGDGKGDVPRQSMRDALATMRATMRGRCGDDVGTVRQPAAKHGARPFPAVMQRKRLFIGRCRAACLP